MPEIGMFGKLAWYFLGIIRHSELLSLKRPPSAYRAERRFAKLFCNWVGFYPFRGPDASLTRQPSYQEPRSGATLTQTGTTHGNQKHKNGPFQFITSRRLPEVTDLEEPIGGPRSAYDCVEQWLACRILPRSRSVQDQPHSAMPLILNVLTLCSR